MTPPRGTEQARPGIETLLGRAPTPVGVREWSLKVSVEELHEAVSELRSKHAARFVDLFGVDRGHTRELHVVLALDSDASWIRLTVDLPAKDSHVPSLVALTPAAGWYERETWSELGAQPEDPPGSAGHARELVGAPEGVVDYPLGPVRSGVVESGHYLLRTVGEEIVDIVLRLSYKRRGVEQRAVGLGVLHLPLLAERISGTDAFAESLALCQALEALVAVDVPPRAAALRTMFAEIERLYNHLGYQADLCQATGLVVGQAQFDILKERVLRLNAQLAGHRYLFGLNVPGGLARDLTADGRPAVAHTTGGVLRELDRLGPMLFGSPSHLDRLEGTGILRPEDASAYAAVGPVGRASAQDRDLRRDHPYAAYRDVGFAVPVHQEGDALARARVRFEEARQSLRIIAQLLDRLPDGPVRVPCESLPPGRCGFGWAESARGETVHWVLTDDAGLVRRYRARPASFANWQAFPLAVPGHNILTDFPVIEQSFALSYAGHDR
jgi:Ni,Fe-hydrogenase III large subunit